MSSVFCIIPAALNLFWLFGWFGLIFLLPTCTYTPARLLPFQSIPGGIPSDCTKHSYQALFLHNRRNTHQDYVSLLWYELQLNKTSLAAQWDQVFEPTYVLCKNSSPMKVKQDFLNFFFGKLFSKESTHGALISFYLHRWDILASR